MVHDIARVKARVSSLDIAFLFVLGIAFVHDIARVSLLLYLSILVVDDFLGG